MLENTELPILFLSNRYTLEKMGKRSAFVEESVKSV